MTPDRSRSLDYLAAANEPLLLVNELIAIADLLTQEPRTGPEWGRLADRLRDAQDEIMELQEPPKR